MTLSIISEQQSGNGHGSSSWTAAAVATTSGRRLRVIAWCVGSTGVTSIEGTSLVISNTGGGVTTWTSIEATTTSPSWDYGIRAWVADQNADGTSITINISNGGLAAEMYRIVVISDDDYTAGGATAINTDADGDGALALTLSAAPASSSVVIGVLCGLLNTGGTGGASPGSGWSVYATTITRSDWWTLHSISRTGSTSTSVDWSDICTGPPGFAANALAFEVRQSSGSPPTITAQPVGAAAVVGATATYSVTSPDATSYQWQTSTNGGENWSNVTGGSGGTTAAYTTPATVAADNGRQYRCVLTNSGGNTNSLGAWFHVSGIGLSRRGRGTSRERQHLFTVGEPFAQNWPLDHRAPSSCGSARFDAFSTAFLDLYFGTPPPPPPPPPQEPEDWVWSTRNRPGSGPLSVGQFYVAPRVIITASQTTGVLTGVAAFSFSTAGALSGAGALAGSSPLTFSPAGALTGSGALAGSVPLVFGSAASLTGSGALAGSSPVTFSASASLSGAGALAGTAAATFSASGTLTSAGSGALSGTSAMTFSTTGALIGAGALSGTVAATFSTAGALTGAGALAGISAAAFGASGALVNASTGDMTGTASMSFGASGALTGSGLLSGIAAFSFLANATFEGAQEETRRRGHAKARKRYYSVTIDDEEFIVATKEEAQALLAEAVKAAEERAKKKAEPIAVLMGREKRKAVAEARSELKPPSITADLPGLQVSDAVAQITAAYQAAINEALRVAREREIDEDDEAVLLLLT